MPKLMVTIDDAGMTPGVNDAVAKCIEAGNIDRIGILSTGSVFEEIFEIPGISGIRVSAHLNCIEPPFLTVAVFPDNFVNWVINSKKYAEKARNEWRAQIECLLDKGVEISGLDSHRHIHHLPGLNSVILELADEYGIGYVRTAVLHDRFARLSGFILDRYGRDFRKLASSRKIDTPDSMLGFSQSGCVTREYLLKYESNIGDTDKVEIVMHPSTRPEWSKGQPGELELLCSEWFAEWRERIEQ